MGERQTGTPDPEQGRIEFWNYETHFREYLLLLGNKGSDALESTANYPYEIGLNKTWHKTHDRMRDGTVSDGLERLAIVGFRRDRHLVLPVTPVPGTAKNIPSSLFFEELHRAKVKADIVNPVGRIHSHPGISPFSAADLYNLLYEHYGPEISKRLPEEQRLIQEFFTGVVTQEEVMYAFKTKETFPVRPSDMFPKNPSEFFQKYWYEQIGYEYRGELGLKKLRPDANLWDLSLGIAKTHNLVLYKGMVGKNLVRYYP